MKLAEYKSMQYDTVSVIECDGWADRSEEYVRISKPVEVTFEPETDETVVRQQLDALEQLERKVEMEHTAKLRAIQQKRAELAALTYTPTAPERDSAVLQ